MKECFNELDLIIEKDNFSKRKIDRWFKVNLPVLSVGDFIYHHDFCPCKGGHKDRYTIFKKLFSIYPIENFKNSLKDIFIAYENKEDIMLIFIVLSKWSQYKSDKIDCMPQTNYLYFENYNLMIKEKYKIDDISIKPIISLISPKLLSKISYYYNSIKELHNIYEDMRGILEKLDLIEYINLFQKEYDMKNYEKYKNSITLKINLTLDFRTRWNTMNGYKKKYFEYIDKFIDISSISDRKNLAKKIIDADDPYKILDYIDDEKWKTFKDNLKNRLENPKHLNERDYNSKTTNFSSINIYFLNTEDKFEFIEDIFTLNTFQSFEDYKYSIEPFQFIAPMIISENPEIEKLGKNIKNFDKILKSYYRKEKSNFRGLIGILRRAKLKEFIPEFEEHYRCTDEMKLKFIDILKKYKSENKI